MVGFANRDRILEFIMRNHDDDDDPDWCIVYRTFADPVRRDRGTGANPGRSR